MNLRHYLFIGEKLIDSLHGQIQANNGNGLLKRIELNLPLPGINLNFGVPRFTDNQEIHYKLSTVEKFLRKNGDLEPTRPLDLKGGWDSNSGKFVLETFTARKIVVPCGKNSQLKEFKDFVVWISDPDPNLYVQKDYVWRGTFLFLVEDWHDQNKYHPTFSGCSALQFIMNVADGRGAIAVSGRERLGRGCALHPIEKLKRLGAKVLEERRLEALYRKRYVSDEQCYTYRGEKRRVNDLVGYPLFIAAA